MQNGKTPHSGNKRVPRVSVLLHMNSFFIYGMDLTNKLDTQFAGSNIYKDILEEWVIFKIHPLSTTATPKVNYLNIKEPIMLIRIQ